MPELNIAIGRETATQLRAPSPVLVPNNSQLSTVGELLSIVDPSHPKRFPMLWSTASNVAACMGVTTSEMPIATLRQAIPDFELWLKSRPYSPKSISTFLYHLRRLISKAEELGYTEEGRALRIAWQPVCDALKNVRIAPRSVPQFAIARGKAPALFTREDLDAWGEWKAKRGLKNRTIRIEKGLFKQAIRKADLTSLFPKLDCDRMFSSYGVRTRDMPEPLRSQVRKLLVWKQAKFVKGRPQKTRHRPISAKLLENVLSRLFGFAVGVGGFKDIASLPELFCEDVVNAFAEWAINNREVSRDSLLRLSMIYGAMRHHPEYKEADYSWFSELCNMLPEDDRAGRIARKAKKKVDYELLRAVPVAIRDAAVKGARNELEKAWLAHDELLMTWLVTLPWRQRNIRECRLGPSTTANLFFAPLERFVHIAKPAWLEESLKANREQSVWQFWFREDETKTGNPVRGILPRRLVTLLEKYLQVHRPRIVCERDPGSLFLNRDGCALERQTTTDLIAELTLKHTGVRVTPHVVRDIFAYAWLDAHPDDFLTLSKILWHKSVQYTLRVYGHDYDESNGVRSIDEWLGAE
jgi:integrase